MTLTKPRRTTIWIWGPVVVMMMLIFAASAQPKHPPPTDADTVYLSGAMPIFSGGWDFVIKKSSHVASYGLLTLLWMRTCRGYGVTPRRAAALAVFAAMVFAITDEFHQAFVVGRRATVTDLGFDYLGASLGSLAARWWMERRASSGPQVVGHML